MARNTEKKIKYEIIDHIADIGSVDKSGYGKEINVMTWGNSKKPVVDIRKWKRTEDEETEVGKGISLSLNEFKQLQKANIENIERYFEEILADGE